MEDRDIELVRVLQDKELFLKGRPFHEAARRLGWTVEEVLERSRSLKASGVIRRFTAFLGPAGKGTAPSALVVFDVEDYRADEVGASLSKHPRVTYCYIRPRFDGFPFNVYATVHADTDDGLKRAVGELTSIAGASSAMTLRTLREFKKSSPVYYPKPANGAVS